VFVKLLVDIGQHEIAVNKILVHFDPFVQDFDGFCEIEQLAPKLGQINIRLSCFGFKFDDFLIILNRFL